MTSPALLCDVPEGEEVRLVSVAGGRAMMRRLAALGLTPGVSLTVVRAAGGPIVLAVRGSRVAVGRGVAAQVQVAAPDGAEGSR